MANIVLIITSEANDAKVLDSTLATAKDGPFVTEAVQQLSDGLARLKHGDIDIILVDLFLPDSTGLETFDALFKAAPQTPIMTLIREADEAFAVEAVQRGAQGFLTKGYLKHALVPQALRNIIQRKQVEESLFIERERAKVTLDSIGDGVISTDVGCNLTYLNKEAERMTGWSLDEACGQPIAKVFHLIDSETRQLARNPIEVVIENKKPMGLHANTMLVRQDGYQTPIEDSIAPILNRQGEVIGAVVTFRDVTQTQTMVHKMAHLAQHDYLTGLPNRLLLNDRLHQAIAYANRHHAELAVLFLDLDNFKHINDSLGHSIGDKLLESIAQRLTAQVRHSDTVSRQGGDEFVILVVEDGQGENAALTAEKVLRALEKPHHIGKHELHITTSIGISLYPADACDADALIRNADTAMYHAKKKGRNNYQFFDSVMNVRAIERQSIEAELRQAIDREEFVLHYQPKVNLESGAITGAEALIRWCHPVKGMIFPDAFIAIAEDAGLIIPIGRLVLRQACRQAKVWVDQGLTPFCMAVNISALEFRHKNFLAGVRAILQETGLQPRCLEIELTESVLMQNAAVSSVTLDALREMGIRLALDDFGTGYSSLSYLNQFPIDVLKIDQSFVQGISATDTDAGIIVSAVICMGKSLGKKVIAEGVETREQLAFLNARHCHEGQGYLFGMPVPANDFVKLFHARPFHPAALH